LDIFFVVANTIIFYLVWIFINCRILHEQKDEIVCFRLTGTQIIFGSLILSSNYC
jgi:hypothetical protein